MHLKLFWFILFFFIFTSNDYAVEIKMNKENIYASYAIGKIKNIKKAKKYKIELSSQNQVIQSWIIKRKRFQKFTEIIIKNLKPKTKYSIRYQPLLKKNRIGSWSESKQFKTKKLVTRFTLKVNKSFPKKDTPYLIIDGNSTSSDAGSFRMIKLKKRTWITEIFGVQTGDKIQYTFSRNDLDNPSYEKVEPDNPNFLREITIDQIPKKISNTVENWR